MILKLYSTFHSCSYHAVYQVFLKSRSHVIDSETTHHKSAILIFCFLLSGYGPLQYIQPQHHAAMYHMILKEDNTNDSTGDPLTHLDTGSDLVRDELSGVTAGDGREEGPEKSNV